MLNVRTTTIDGIDFAVGQLPAMRGHRLLPRLGKAIGPALAQGFDAMGGKGGDGDLGKLGAAIGLLFEHLTPDEYEAILRELFSTVAVKGAPLMDTFDVALAGKPATVIKLAAFCLEANFGNFSGVAQAWAARAAAMTATGSGSSSPSTSATSGPSGA